jgi:seryl-tRNA synthetase
LTYDFKCFLPQDRWLNGSVSNSTFQANRLKLRFKDKGKKSIGTHLTEVHWLCQGFGRNFRKLQTPEGL